MVIQDAMHAENDYSVAQVLRNNLAQNLLTWRHCEKIVRFSWQSLPCYKCGGKLTYTKAFTPNAIKSKPAKTSNPFVGRCFNLPPNAKPKIELAKVTKAIRSAGLSIQLPNNDKVIPAENASILVAIPTKIKHLKSIQSCCSFSLSNASIIIFTPKYVNIKNTIKPA